MASSRSKELYQALQAKGYSDDFCRELAQAQAAINRMYRKGWEVKGKTGEISIGI